MKTDQATKINQSTFSLLRLRKQCYYPPFSADYAPMNRSNLGLVSILPKFNKDGNFFTPAFVNPYEQSRQAPNSGQLVQEQRQKFLKKIQNNLSLPSEQNVQFNPRDDNYCSICRMSFECYWDHVNDKKHASKIKISKANKYIHSLCNGYQKKKNFKPKKTSKDEPQILKKKKKLIKKNTKKTQLKQTHYKKEDFIITFPKEIIEKQLEMAYCNNSTNGIISLQLKQ